MFVNSTQVQNNFGHFLQLAQNDEVRILKNGVVVATLRGIELDRKSLVDNLVGIIPIDVSIDAARNERLDRQ
jgi:hypothetical protein